MIEIAGVKTLYTGDFSRQEDRHLMSAEIPPIKPEVLIIESTYGTHIHEPREARETRFCEIVHSTIKRAGRCLIPVFALGRAQELLLILDEYWSQHPELHDIPIYYASLLAKKCMSVYQTYISAMNDRIKKQIAINNPFVFKHISNLKSIDHFEDCGPCVIMATPGMLQSGLSRELFEAWCGSPENSCIIAGYCVEGRTDCSKRNGSEIAFKQIRKDEFNQPNLSKPPYRHPGKADPRRTGGDRNAKRNQNTTQMSDRVHLVLGSHRLLSDVRVHSHPPSAAHRSGARRGKRDGSSEGGDQPRIRGRPQRPGLVFAKEHGEGMFI